MSDEVGVIFFNHGQAHLARLVVSLLSLRRHHPQSDLSVTILDTGESGGIIDKIEADDRLGAYVKPIGIRPYRRHTAYVRKASLWRESPFETTIYLDADTLVARPLTTLMEIASDRRNKGFIVTKFSDWVTTGDLISGRIRQWQGVKCKGVDVDKLVRESLAASYPAINSGVICWRSDAEETLENWERLTAAGWKCSWTDELSAQLLLRQEPHTLVGDRYNCSPIYGKEKEKAVVFHSHGKKHLTRADGRGREAHKIWEPLFREAFEVNAGGIRDWAPAGDGALANNMGLFVGS